MVNYNGLVRIKLLLLGSAMLGASASYAAVVPPPDANASEAAAPAPADAAPAPAGKASPALRERTPLRYVVKKGDTLWSIANHFLLNAWEWPEIWYVNGQVRNPHKIYPGDVLELMVVKGRPQLVNQTPPPAPEEDRLSPQVRVSAIKDAIPAIPIDAIRDFLQFPHVVTKDELKKAPYILDFVGEHMMAGTSTEIYVRRLPRDKPVSDFAVVRMGSEYKDPDTGEVLGYEATSVGSATVETPGDPGVAMLTRTSREALAGDYLIPVEAADFDAYFYPHSPPADLRASIISVYDGVSQVGQYQVVTLNRGGRNGVEPGQVFTVMQSNRTARDPYGSLGSGRVKLPDLKAGTLMVFKVTPKVSFALIMEATRSIQVLDKAVTPTAD